MKIVFRILILLTLLFNFYNAFIGDIVPRFSFNAWGQFKTGPFLTVLFVWLILEIINYFSVNHGIALPSSLWGFVAFGLILDSTSDYTFIYDKLRNYDKVMHFLVGGLLSGFIIIKIIEYFSAKSPLPPLLKYSLTILLINFAGFLYEIFEFITDRFLNASNIRSRFDTTEDMILNLLGAVLISFIHYLFFQPAKKIT